MNDLTFGKRTLQGKTALITGASSGLGAALATVFAHAGMHLMLVGRNRDKLKDIQQQVQSYNVKVAFCDGDIRDEAFCQNCVDQTMQHYSSIDVVVNNAGAIDREALKDTSTAEWKRIMETNVDGVFYLTRAALKVMNAGSTIVNVASSLSYRGAADLVSYSASKGAVVNFTKALAVELGPQQITVNAIAPGAMDTPMLFGEHRSHVTVEQVRQSNIDAIPLGRIAHPIEVARATHFLAEETHITGAVLSIDGGYTAQ